MPLCVFSLSLSLSFSRSMWMMHRVDGCLCDGCGVLSQTKETWQTAGLRLDQTGLVYWTSPSLLRAHHRLCVRLQSEVSLRSALSSKTGTTQTTHRVASVATKEGQKRGWHTHCAYALLMNSCSHSVCICINSKQSKDYFLSHSWPLL